MATFALVNAGTIIETGPTAFPVAAPLVWTSDISTITPQPAVGWGASQSGGGVWSYTAPPAQSAPTLAQLAAVTLGAGLAITLSGSLTLAATLFPTDPTTQAKLSAVVTTINATGEFPGGATTYPMKDASGAWHTFTVAQYKTVAGAIAAYVAALDLIADGNPLEATELPANAVSLTV